MEMILVAVTDIYGRTSFFYELLTILKPKYEVIEVVDPYNNLEIHFNNEQEAYTYFQEQIGLKGYIAKLHQLLIDNKYLEVHLLGFSVGASAVWAISELLNFSSNSKGICFYGSQIRNLKQVRPLIEMDLYFPITEQHFDVNELIKKLNNRPKINCYKTDYLHGFMNKKSKNFNESGYIKYMEILKNI